MRLTPVVILLCGVGLGGCGGGGGEALVGGSLTGEYAGEAFTPDVGVAAVYMDANLLAIGDGDMNCSSPDQADPPSGNTAVISVPAFDPGTYGGVFVNMFHNVGGDFSGAGSNTGDVTITAASADSVVGTVAYSYTDDTGAHYAVSGSFEVVRCAN